MTASPLDPDLLAAVRGVAIAARAMERHLDAMSLAQMRILTLIARDPIRANVLAERAALSRPTLTGLIDGLVAKGWIDRCTVDGDRRGVALAITERGRRSLTAAHQEAADALSELLDELSPTQQRATMMALGHLTTAAQIRHTRRLAETGHGA